MTEVWSSPNVSLFSISTQDACRTTVIQKMASTTKVIFVAYLSVLKSLLSNINKTAACLTGHNRELDILSLFTVES